MKKNIIDFNSSQRNKEIPDLRAGDIVKITRKIKEGEKEISQNFEGIIIAVKGKQSSSPMITVRKVSHGVGVELILPVFSPNISRLVLVKRAKVRRAKLYYIREKTIKSLKMKYKDLSEFAKIEEKAEEIKPTKEEKKEVLEATSEKK
jgi:large subunit ribosomal protein L19